MVLETGKEYTQDVIFGLAFLAVAVLAGWRMLIYFDPNGGGKVITAFYALIFGCASMRSIWFLIPKSALEGSYTPLPTIAFVTPGWQGAFISEILLVIGSLCLFAVFILIVCYWAHMLRKVESVETPDTSQLSAAQRTLARYPRAPKPRRGPMQNFAIVMLMLGLIEVVNICLFLFQIYNSEGMLFFDSILMSTISLITLVQITVFSQRIRIVLMTIGVINANSTKPQVRRILAITVAANIFFIWRVVTELLLTVMFVLAWKQNQNFNIILSNKYWDLYINIKHWSEVVVLVLELLISTAIKSPVSATAATSRIRRLDSPAEQPKGNQRPHPLSPYDNDNDNDGSTDRDRTTSDSDSHVVPTTTNFKYKET
eukprot:gene7316-14914_t